MGRIFGDARRLVTRGALVSAAILGSGGYSSATSAAANPTPAGSTSTFLTSLQKATQIASTVPGNGDVNPYGIAVVPTTVGNLVRGATLVSNFNDKANVQGTGTTIVEVAPNGTRSKFAQIDALPRSEPCPGGIGLTAALAVLPGGWVAVGSLPAGPGGALPTEHPAGCLIVLNSSGIPVETWTNANIDGPWYMTVTTKGSTAEVFVSNVLGSPLVVTTPPKLLSTVVRIDVTLSKTHPPVMRRSTVVGDGFPWTANKAAFAEGPTGLVLGANGTLYVAETLANDIAVIPGALTRTDPITFGSDVLTSGGSLNGPLGLTLAPDDDLVAVNGDDGRAVEITQRGKQVATVTLVSHGDGDLIGVTRTASGDGLLFGNDGTNALDVAQTG